MVRIRIQNLLLVIMTLALTGCAHPPTDMWRCTATDLSQMHWIQYSPTRIEAATRAIDQCEVGAYRSTCVVRCIPPTLRWHCIAIDKGGHTWYWNSTDRDIAVRNAQQACLLNTTLGGCQVPISNCSMT